MSLRAFASLALTAAFVIPPAYAEVAVMRKYNLHPPRDGTILFGMAVTPQQDVLTFVANGEGKWRFSRVRGWLDKEPQDETITVPGLSLGGRRDWFTPWAAQLLVTPDGQFVVCVSSGMRTQPFRGEDAFISVVDLSEFKLAGSMHAYEADWLSGGYRKYHLDNHGHLIVQSYTLPRRRPGEDVSVMGNQIKIALLSIPDLTPVDRCQYSEWKYGGKVGRRENEQDCDKLLSDAGGGASLEDFSSEFVTTDEVSVRDDKSRPPQCAFLSYGSYISRDGRFRREICQDAHRGFWGNYVVSKSAENIYSVQTGKQVGRTDEPTDSVNARFASINGQEYLLLMEGGTRLTVYKIAE